MKAVVDRFEGEWAVLIVDSQPLNVRRDVLPAEVREGHHLEVIVEEGQVMSAVMDKAETESVLQRIREKVARLRRSEHLKRND